MAEDPGKSFFYFGAPDGYVRFVILDREILLRSWMRGGGDGQGANACDSKC